MSCFFQTPNCAELCALPISACPGAGPCCTAHALEPRKGPAHLCAGGVSHVKHAAIQGICREGRHRWEELERPSRGGASLKGATSEALSSRPRHAVLQAKREPRPGRGPPVPQPRVCHLCAESRKAGGSRVLPDQQPRPAAWTQPPVGTRQRDFVSEHVDAWLGVWMEHCCTREAAESVTKAGGADGGAGRHETQAMHRGLEWGRRMAHEDAGARPLLPFPMHLQERERHKTPLTAGPAPAAERAAKQGPAPLEDSRSGPRR